jgi:hypothetical protein
MKGNLNKINKSTLEKLANNSALLNNQLLNLLKTWLHILSVLAWS